MSSRVGDKQKRIEKAREDARQKRIEAGNGPMGGAVVGDWVRVEWASAQLARLAVLNEGKIGERDGVPFVCGWLLWNHSDPGQTRPNWRVVEILASENGKVT